MGTSLGLTERTNGFIGTVQKAQDRTAVIPRNVSVQSDKENNLELPLAGKARRISSMRPDSPAFVPSVPPRAKKPARTNSSVFLPSLGNSIFASTSSPDQLSRSVKSLHHASSSQIGYSLETSRPILVSSENQSTVPIIKVKEHSNSTRPHLLQPNQRVHGISNNLEGSTVTRNVPPLGLVQIGKAEEHPISILSTFLEVSQPIDESSTTAEGVAEPKGELPQEVYSLLGPAVLPKDETGRTTSTPPRLDPCYTLCLLDSPPESEGGCELAGSSPIKHVALTPSKPVPISPKSTHIQSGRDIGEEENVAEVMERLKLHLQIENVESGPKEFVKAVSVS